MASSTVCGQMIVHAPEVVERFAHMFSFSTTRPISNCERLRFVKPLQLLNILPINITFAVLKLERSRLVRLLHPSNIPVMSLAFDVLKPETFRLVSPPQA